MFADRFGDRAENNPLFRQFGAIGGRHRHAVKHRVYRHHAGQRFLFFQRDAQLVIGFQQLLVNLVQAFWGGFPFGAE